MFSGGAGLVSDKRGSLSEDVIRELAHVPEELVVRVLCHDGDGDEQLSFDEMSSIHVDHFMAWHGMEVKVTLAAQAGMAPPMIRLAVSFLPSDRGPRMDSPPPHTPPRSEAA